MILTKDEFDKKLKGKNLRIAVIGMSNIGKSFRSKQLANEKEFELFSVDDKIEKKLGIDGLKKMAIWMGLPFEKRYASAEAKYLAAEAEVMKEAKPVKGKNCVLDTTGSVVYLPEKVLEKLKRDFFVLHLALVGSMVERMTERFFSRPKPVIWGGMFDKSPKESPEVALRRCYPKWLKFRHEKYKKLADLSISGEFSVSDSISCDEFLDAIRENLT